MTMPLILAIEPDRSQANQLKAVVRARLRAELVLADTAEAALKALGPRIPDLVLTSAFLSPRDEAALAERLRTLDVAAAHVQTLTIPVLDAPKPAHAARGVLSSLLRDRASQSAPDGCDPAVFAEQCAAYLERAAHERVAPPVVHDDDQAENALAAVDIVFEPESVPVIAAADQQRAAMPELEAVVEPAADPDPEPEAEPAFELDLSSLLDENVVHELSAAIENVTATDPRRSTQQRAQNRTEKWTPIPVGNKTQWPRMDALCAESVPAVNTPAPAPSPVRHRARPAVAAPVTRAPQAKPVKDDWGLFDPAQCGFAALLAKFDEVTQVAPPLPTDSASAGPLDVSR